jgi:hypothetical protein
MPLNFKPCERAIREGIAVSVARFKKQRAVNRPDTPDRAR